MGEPGLLHFVRNDDATLRRIASLRSMMTGRVVLWYDDGCYFTCFIAGSCGNDLYGIVYLQILNRPGVDKPIGADGGMAASG
ncbi:MAG: hypothetical protein LBB84_13065 [Tannerellaceae bacterium]|nr:hypothetical protein [Tannerellaceae bacterium]